MVDKGVTTLVVVLGPETHVYVMTPVPPLPDAVRVVELPEQRVAELDITLTVKADGIVIVADEEFVQPLASVTVAL